MGQIYNRSKLTQVLNFQDLTWGKIGPSDLDAVLELKDKAYVIIEAKEQGARWPRGQGIMLERLTKDLIRSGKHVLTIRATHNTETPQDIDIASCSVYAYLDRPRGWQMPTVRWTVRELIDIYLAIWEIDL